MQFTVVILGNELIMNVKRSNTIVPLSWCRRTATALVIDASLSDFEITALPPDSLA
jgi:hypothetical protein